MGDALAARLAGHGDRCISLTWSAHATDEDVRAVLASASRSTANGAPLRAVVHLAGLDATGPTQDGEGDFGCGALASPVGSWASSATAPRLWVVTRGAQRVGGAGSVNAAQAPLWGFRSGALRRSARACGGAARSTSDRGETSGELHAAAIERAIEESIADDGAAREDQVAVRDDEQYVARIERRSDLLPKEDIALRADGAYLVTGGLGGLGLKVARWMVDRGARQLLLLGRTGLPARTEWDAAEGDVAARVAAVRELEALGANVAVVAADVADEQSLGAALAAFAAENAAPIRGVIHAAGVGHLCPVGQMTAASLEEQLRPKVLGATNLDRLLAKAPLDFFVLYSSLSAVLPSPLLAGYAASNAFLEAVARNRHARGKPALCVHWGMWGEVGMAARAQSMRAGATPKSEHAKDWKSGSLAPEESARLRSSSSSPRRPWSRSRRGRIGRSWRRRTRRSGACWLQPVRRASTAAPRRA